jgi:hypothetical protein
MPDDPPHDPDKLDDSEAERRFNDLVGRLVKTPHKPHKPVSGEDKAKRGK